MFLKGSAAYLESICSVSGGHPQRVSMGPGSMLLGVFTTCFLGSSQRFGVTRHKVVRLVSRERHIVFQVWLRLIFRSCMWHSFDPLRTTGRMNELSQKASKLWKVFPQ